MVLAASRQVRPPALYTFKPRLFTGLGLHGRSHTVSLEAMSGQLVNPNFIVICVCSQVRPPALYTFKPSLNKKQLPKKLDWRATPADFAVKDQGQCGSCWVSGRLVTAGWACLVWRCLRHHSCVHITLGRARSYNLIRVWNGS